MGEPLPQRPPVALTAFNSPRQTDIRFCFPQIKNNIDFGRDNHSSTIVTTNGN